MRAGPDPVFLPPLPGEGWGGGTTASETTQHPNRRPAPIPAFPRRGKEHTPKPSFPDDAPSFPDDRIA